MDNKDIQDSINETKAKMAPVLNNKGERTGQQKTQDNIHIVLENDIRYKDRLAYDVVAGRPVIVGKVHWDNPLLAQINTDLHPLLGEKRYMDDQDIAEMVREIQRDYGMSVKGINDQIEPTCKHHPFDPIKERLEYLGSKYDGGEYIKQLLPHFLGVEDDSYQASVMLLTMLAFIERQYHPGSKYDAVLCLLGDTGLGKTTYVRRLGFWDGAYYANVTDDIQNKDVLQIVAHKRFLEFGEMMSLIKSKKEAIKDFYSAEQDTFRNPYGKMFVDYVRKCIFIATSNETDILTDKTSSRRFLIVECHKDNVKDITEILRPEAQELFDKAWGEAFVYWQKTRPENNRNYLMEYLNDLAPEAKKHADLHYEYDPMQGMIMEYLQDKIDEYENSWNSKLNQYDGPVPRVCVKEILDYLEMDNAKRYEKKDITAILDNNADGWHRMDKIQRCGHLGPQRCWEYEPKEHVEKIEYKGEYKARKPIKRLKHKNKKIDNYNPIDDLNASVDILDAQVQMVM